MCNLYRMKKSAAEVAAHFRASDAAAGANFGTSVYPGYPGMVVVDGEARSMAWGFPLERTGKTGKPLKPKPVNNARTDKLKSWFWRDSFERRRCLIPVSAWAEAEGPRGSMTRTWMSVPGDELFAVAGIWKDTDAFGPAFSMVMTDAAGPAARVHSRMPVILSAQDWDRWQQAEPADAYAMCRAWDGPLEIDRTDEPWFARRSG